MLANLRNIWRPANYHGRGKKAPYFEGWYYKVVDATGKNAYAIIPGVFIGPDPESSHCFIQSLNGETGLSTYHRYPFESFVASEDVFDVKVGASRFTGDRIELDVDMPERRLRGTLRFSGSKPWPVTPFSPGIMGWYAFVPKMECYHGVLSFDHAIDGTLEIDGREVDFTSGRGYIEKDWGQSFPKAWVWMQSNHFGSAGVSLTASVAIIPWLRSAFNGFIVGLHQHGSLYRWATYTGARVEQLEVTDKTVRLIVADALRRSPAYRLEILAERSQAGLLRSPERTAMLQRVLETLTATIHVRLLDAHTGQLLFEGAGRHAGLEVVGVLPPIAGD